MFEGVLLHGAVDHLLSAACLPVGDGYDGSHLVAAALDDGVEVGDGKVGSSEEYCFHQKGSSLDSDLR